MCHSQGRAHRRTTGTGHHQGPKREEGGLVLTVCRTPPTTLAHRTTGPQDHIPGVIHSLHSPRNKGFGSTQRGGLWLSDKLSARQLLPHAVPRGIAASTQLVLASLISPRTCLSQSRSSRRELELTALCAGCVLPAGTMPPLVCGLQLLRTTGPCVLGLAPISREVGSE